MNWQQRSPATWYTACGRGMIMRNFDCFLMHWRAAEGDTWRQLVTRTRVPAYRTSLDRAKIAVEDYLRKQDRERGERTMDDLRRVVEAA